MPIPLKPANSGDARGLSTGMSGSPRNTEASALAYEVIVAASVLDAWRQDIFVKLLGGAESVGTAAYLAINTRAPKVAAITAAAKSVLPDFAFSRFKKLVDASEKIEKYRDKLAHWQRYEVERVGGELCLRDPMAPRDPNKAPALGIFVFSKQEMRDHIAYAVELADAQFIFLRVFESGPPWEESDFASLDLKLEYLATLRGTI
ncbi:hypothetical protein [Hyphomonas sp.]|uniref:hypothetical protein n=1 Tax=Hyphomonas sp. TaxID=87 RepID=UPI0032425D55